VVIGGGKEWEWDIGNGLVGDRGVVGVERESEIEEDDVGTSYSSM
jgi:hypothetical protein